MREYVVYADGGEQVFDDLDEAMDYAMTRIAVVESREVSDNTVKVGGRPKF